MVNFMVKKKMMQMKLLEIIPDSKITFRSKSFNYKCSSYKIHIT